VLLYVIIYNSMKRNFLLAFVILLLLLASWFCFRWFNFPEKVVFYDKNVGTSWIDIKVSEKVRKFFVKKGFNSLNAAELNRWMQEVIDRGKKNCIVVFTQDKFPAFLLNRKGNTSLLIRRYLDSGGNIIWMGAWPRISARDFKEIFGFLPPEVGKKGKSVKITTVGKKTNFKNGWISKAPALRKNVDIVFTGYGKDFASAWIKLYTSKSGFVRLWDTYLKKIDKQKLKILLSLASGEWKFDFINIEVSSVPYFAWRKQALFRAVRLDVNSWSDISSANIVINAKNFREKRKLKIKKGKQYFYLMLPDFSRKQELKILFQAGKHILRRKIALSPERKWKLFLTPSIHTDIGFTNLQENVFKLRRKNIDRILDAMEKYPDLKWNFEVFFLVEDYLKHIDNPSKKHILLNLLRSKRVEINPVYLNVLLGLSSSEAVNRLFYPWWHFSKKYKIKANFASFTDVPVMLWTFPLALKSADMRYFIQGFNVFRAPLFSEQPLKGERFFWWKGFADCRIFTVTSPYGMGEKLGLNKDLNTVEKVLPQFLDSLKHYPSKEVLLYGYLHENASVNFNFVNVIRKWNRKWAYPEFIIATNSEVLDYFDRKYGNKAPVYKFDGGTCWEDGVASTAKETAIHRKNQREIVTLEKILTIASLSGSDSYPFNKLDQIWRNILFFNEHTWGALQSVLRPHLKYTREMWEYKANFVYEAEKEIKELKKRAQRSFASLFNSGKNPAIVVFNPLSWTRDGVVNLYIPNLSDSFSFCLKEISEGKNIPYAVKGNFISFIARRVPEFGYKIYSLIPGKCSFYNREFKTNVLENGHYRIIVDWKTGKIQSFVHKGIGKEILDRRSKYSFNQLIYLMGGEGTKAINNTAENSPVLASYSPIKIRNIRYRETSIDRSLEIKYRTDGIPNIKNFSSEIILYKGLKYLEIRNHFYKEETLRKEALLFAYPFKIENPEPYVELPNGYVRPGLDQTKGSCKDWYATQNWVALKNKYDIVGISSPEAPLFMFGDINIGKWMGTLKLKNGAVFSYVMNNYWNTNYKASQGGRYTFRYIIFTLRDNKISQALKKGWEMSFPLQGILVPPGTKGKFIASKGSFIKIDKPNVIVTAFKVAENKDGLVIRLREIEGKPTTFSIKIPFIHIKEAYICNLMEEEKKPLDIKGDKIYYKTAPFSVITIKAKF